MKLLTPDYYSEFKCIGGSCIDTCCAGWEVDVDKKSSEYYKSVTGPFGERIKSVLVELPVEDQFRLKPDKRCPFLNEANLCDLCTIGYSKLARSIFAIPVQIFLGILQSMALLEKLVFPYPARFQ